MNTDVINTQFMAAVLAGNAPLVEKLLPRADPLDNNSFALQVAAQRGYAECVRALIPVSGPKWALNHALRLAAKNGHVECVAHLIPVSDPQNNHNEALQLAVIGQHHACVEVLYPVSNVHEALSDLQTRMSATPEVWHSLYDMIEAKRIKAVLGATLGEHGAPRSRKI